MAYQLMPYTDAMQQYGQYNEDPSLNGGFDQGIQAALEKNRIEDARRSQVATPSMPPASQGQASGGGTPLQSLLSAANTGKNIYKLFAGSGPAGATTATTGATTGAATAGTGAATTGTAASGAASSTSGLAGGMSALGPWAIPVAAAGVLSGVALAEGETPGAVFGKDGWGGQPMQFADNLFRGDIEGMGRSIGGPIGGIAAAAGGGNGWDIAKAGLGGPAIAVDNIVNKGGGDALDWIKVFANPLGFGG